MNGIYSYHSQKPVLECTGGEQMWNIMEAKMKRPKKFTKQRQRAAFRIAKAMMDLSESGNLYVVPYDELASLRPELDFGKR